MTATEIRTMRPADRAATIALLLQIPQGEHMFVKHSVADAHAAGAWLDTLPPEHYLVASVDGTVAGAVAIVPGTGWSAHVSELLLVVHPAHRRHGLAKAMARAALRAAVERGALVVTVEALAEQQSVIDLFRGLGFVPEALLTDHVQDAHGELHDLVKLVHSVRSTAAGTATVGLLEPV